MELDNDWTNLPPPTWNEVKKLQEENAKLENHVDVLEEATDPTQFWLKKTIEMKDMPEGVKRECRICQVKNNRFEPVLPDFEVYEDKTNREAVALLNVYKNPFLPHLVRFKAKEILDAKHAGYYDVSSDGEPEIKRCSDNYKSSSEGSDKGGDNDGEEDGNDDGNDDGVSEEANGLVRILERCRQRGSTVNYIEEYYASAPLGYLSNGWPYGEGNNGEVIPLNYKLARAALLGEPGSFQKYSKWKAIAMRKVSTLEVKK